MITDNKAVVCPLCNHKNYSFLPTQVQLYDEPIKVSCEKCEKEFMATFKNTTQYQSWNIGE